MEMPIIVITGCEKHCTVTRQGIVAVTSGPESSQAARDWFFDCITCWQCWARDEPGMLAVCAAFNMSPEIIVGLRRKVMRNKLADNRN